MEIGSLLLIVAVLILVVAYVYSPFVEKVITEFTESEKNQILLEAQQKAVLKYLVELDFDLEIGKISTEAHQLNRVGLLLRAETIYQKISNIQAIPIPTINNTQIEKKIKKHKNSQSRIINCTECGMPIFTSDKYCGECGLRNQQ